MERELPEYKYQPDLSSLRVLKRGENRSENAAAGIFYMRA